MKSKKMFVAFFVALLLAVASGTAWADTPTVTITAPSGVLTTTSFPFTTSITFNLTHSELKNLNVLDVQVNGVGIVNGGEPIGNPFTNANACTTLLISNSTSCNASDSNNATVSVPWDVLGVGSYTITVSVKHQNAEGEDEEVVQVALLTAEYPAPPAIANAFINGDPYLKKVTSAKKRGCAISQIAIEHGQNEKYGPKGGPYDDTLVQTDVLAFLGACQ